MSDTLKRVIILCLAACTSMSYAHAQPKAAGSSYSLCGVGLTYEHYLNRDAFLHTDLRAEMLAVFMNRENNPGISASLSYNLIFKEWKSRNSNTICLFGGPGVALGMSHDFRKDMGYFFGLKGRVGVECCFDRHISVSLTLNPVIGSHMVLKEKHIEMKYYKNGLISTLFPEIGIEYEF